MTVQELFKTVNENDFIDLYLKNDHETINLLFSTKYSVEEKIQKIAKFKQIVIDALHSFQTMEIEKKDEYIVFSVPRFDDDVLADSFLVKREELLHPEKVERIETYAYEFSPHAEILGYDISQACLYEYGDKTTFAVSIFNEMTFCGITEESHTQKVNDIKKQLDEAEEEIENDFSKAKTIEEFFAEIGWKDKRTEEEKEFSLAVAKIQGMACSEIYKKYYEMEKYYLKKGE